MHRRMLVLALCACSSDPKPRPVPVSTPAPAAIAPTDAAPDAQLVATLDAAPVTPDAAVALRECFCFAWVHLDENGDFCYPTRAGCEERFRTFGRTDKIPCRSEQRPSCERIACVEIGKRCFRE